MKKEYVVKAGIIVLLLAVLAGGVAYGIKFGGGTVPASGAGVSREMEQGDDAVPEVSEEEMTQINLKQDESTVSGDGARVDGNRILISKSGAYHLTGTLTDGQIYVETPKNQGDVVLDLDGVEITNLTDAAIYIENADHTYVLLEDGTVNRLQSGQEVEILTGASEAAALGATAGSPDGGKASGQSGDGASDENMPEGTLPELPDGSMPEGTPPELSDGSMPVGGDFGRNPQGRQPGGRNPGGFPQGDPGMNGMGDAPDGNGTADSSSSVEISSAAESAAAGTETDDARGAAFYARDDLTIGGNGSLEVYGYLNNGIQSSNDLTIQGGKFTVEAVNHGIKGKDSLTVLDGDLVVRAGGDGLKSDDATGEGYGTILIVGGGFHIESGGDGIQAETVLEVRGGSFSVLTGGGSEGVEFPADNGWGMHGAQWDLQAESEESAKGLKSGTSLVLSGGDFDVNSRDDAFHTNGNLEITGGSYTVATGDDGFHADIALTVEDGTLLISRSYEGLEAVTLMIAGGDLDITAADDGINANGGQQGFGWDIMRGTDDDLPRLHITGGNIVVYADGDGIDSNGDLIIEGGNLVVNGPTQSANGALDSGLEMGGACLVNGGTILALGNAGMAENFSRDSAQCSFQYSGSSFGAGTELVITDAQGTELCRHTTVKSGSSVVFSSPDLQDGQTYTLRIGEESVEITLQGKSTSQGSLQGGQRGWRGR